MTSVEPSGYMQQQYAQPGRGYYQPPEQAGAPEQYPQYQPVPEPQHYQDGQYQAEYGQEQPQQQVQPPYQPEYQQVVAGQQQFQSEPVQYAQDPTQYQYNQPQQPHYGDQMQQPHYAGQPQQWDQMHYSQGQPGQYQPMGGEQQHQPEPQYRDPMYGEEQYDPNGQAADVTAYQQKPQYPGMVPPHDPEKVITYTAPPQYTKAPASRSGHQASRHAAGSTTQENRGIGSVPPVQQKKKRGCC